MTRKKAAKWRTIIGLAIMFTAVIVQINWIWGVFYLYWVIPDIVRGRAYFIEDVDKTENPILYYVIIFSFLFLSFYVLTEPLFS